MSGGSIRTVDMHTGGEPVRIVVGGYPDIPGDTILDKRRHAREHLDHLRRLLMHEPRGHTDMYGVIPVSPDHPDADLAVLFMHNEGYSTMCGHATIALGRFAVDRGLVPVTEPTTTVRLQVPAGLLTLDVEVRAGRSGSVRFESMPAFVHGLDLAVDVPGRGTVAFDVGYGGAFYAVAAASQFGLDVRASPVRDLVDAAAALTAEVQESTPLHHPDDPELAFLYGTILTDGAEGLPGRPSANVCVFADAQVDRSPTGSGVMARLAVQRRRGRIEIGERREFESVTGSRFTGTLVRDTEVGNRQAVIVAVAGEAFYTGEATFTLEAGDDLGRGFLLR